MLNDVQRAEIRRLNDAAMQATAAADAGDFSQISAVKALADYLSALGGYEDEVKELIGIFAEMCLTRIAHEVKQQLYKPN